MLSENFVQWFYVESKKELRGDNQINSPLLRGCQTQSGLGVVESPGLFLSSVLGDLTLSSSESE